MNCIPKCYYSERTHFKTGVLSWLCPVLTPINRLSKPDINTQFAINFIYFSFHYLSLRKLP